MNFVRAGKGEDMQNSATLVKRIERGPIQLSTLRCCFLVNSSEQTCLSSNGETLKLPHFPLPSLRDARLCCAPFFLAPMPNPLWVLFKDLWVNFLLRTSSPFEHASLFRSQALAVHNGGPTFVVLGPRDPHLLEGAEGGQDRAPDPGG